MVSHQPSPTDAIEDGATADQREQPEQDEDGPHFIQLRIVGAVVVGELVDVTAAWKVDRDNELEVTTVLGGIALVSRVRRSMFQSGIDAGVGVGGAHQSTVARRPDHVLLVDQERLPGAGTLRDAFKQTIDVAYPVRGAGCPDALAFKRLRVRPLGRRKVGDLSLREIAFHEDIARDANQREGQGYRRKQADAKRKRRPVLVHTMALLEPARRMEQPAARRLRRLRRQGRGHLLHGSLSTGPSASVSKRRLWGTSIRSNRGTP